MLQNGYLVAKIGVDTAENELFEVVGKCDVSPRGPWRRGPGCRRGPPARVLRRLGRGAQRAPGAAGRDDPRGSHHLRRLTPEGISKTVSPVGASQTSWAGLESIYTWYCISVTAYIYIGLVLGCIDASDRIARAGLV